MSYLDDIDNMIFSFSRLHAYEQCPYQFYLTYIEKQVPQQNFYAENGTCVHEVLEEIFNKKINVEDAPYAYTEKYELILNQIKQNIMDSTYEKCVDYFYSMKPLDEDRYQILGVELNLKFLIGEYKFTGFIDLLLKDKNTGEIILVDHKQSSPFFKKDGTPLKNQADTYLAYRRQAYLYCKGIQDIMGIKVDRIAWNHFKSNGKLSIIPFVQSEYDDAIQWATSIINRIKEDIAFEANNKSFVMCSNLCGFREDCEYKYNNTEE